MVGLPIALGIIQSASRALVQVPSSGLRLAATKLVDEMSRDTPMRKLLLRYAALSLCQVSQAVACNGLHSVRRRCCRWLLMTHDRVEGDEFPMTHEFLAQMLGVRRASVTTVLTPLQKAGLIRSRRGKIAVVDRERLEENSCECYRTVQQEYIRLLG
jgi:CRP-like cAMP-binding protein